MPRVLSMSLRWSGGVPAPGRAAFVAAALCATLSAPPPAAAQWLAPAGEEIRIVYGPTAIHFNPSPDHVHWNHLVGLELLTPRWAAFGASRTLLGFASFDNSFGQPSQYLYGGLEWDLGRLAGGTVFGSVTAGLLRGYTGEHQDKIPFNGLGIAPVIIPAVGWRYKRFGAWMTLLGFNGLMYGVSWTFPLD